MKRTILWTLSLLFLIITVSFTTEGDSHLSNAQETPEYSLMDLPMVNLSHFPQDADGWITLFDGETLNGWRGYNKNVVPSCWTVDEEAIHIINRRDRPYSATRGKSYGEDLVFAFKFKDFELEFEWKVGRRANSGVFYKVQEVEGQDAFISSPEYQILDNENHPDAKAGKNGNRKSASLYDMIPADPQNSKPFGEWNQGKIKVENGTVTHYQNGVAVVTYKMYTPEWNAMLNVSKFSKEKWPLAFELLSNCGGSSREGLIGFQDHHDDAWFRNIRIRVIE